MPAHSESIRARLSFLEDEQSREPDLMALLSHAADSDRMAKAMDLSRCPNQFMTLAAARKLDVLQQIVGAPSSLQKIDLSGLGLDNSHSPCLAAILRRPSLTDFAVERNALSEVGLLSLADALLALDGQTRLATLAVANQRTIISTLATTRLLDAMEATQSLCNLRLGTLRDDGVRKRHQALTMANTEAKRLRRQSEGGDSCTYSSDEPVSPSEARAPSVPVRTPRSVSKALLDRVSSIEAAVSSRIEDVTTIVDWVEEARRIATSSLSLGSGVGGQAANTDTTTYTMTGNAHWLRATDEERRAVIGSFASNVTVRTMIMANAGISDGLAVALGQMLAHNSTITRLQLESNSISSAGVEALASALRADTCALCELKLANQRQTYSQRSEESLAAALEFNTRLTKLTFDHRSTRARDLVRKFITRNEGIAREAMREHQRLSNSAAIIGPEDFTKSTSARRLFHHAPACLQPTSSSCSGAGRTPAAVPSAASSALSLDHTAVLHRARARRSKPLRRNAAVGVPTVAAGSKAHRPSSGAAEDTADDSAMVQTTVVVEKQVVEKCSSERATLDGPAAETAARERAVAKSVVVESATAPEAVNAKAMKAVKGATDESARGKVEEEAATSAATAATNATRLDAMRRGRAEVETARAEAVTITSEAPAVAERVGAREEAGGTAGGSTHAEAEQPALTLELTTTAVSFESHSTLPLGSALFGDLNLADGTVVNSAAVVAAINDEEYPQDVICEDPKLKLGTAQYLSCLPMCMRRLICLEYFLRAGARRPLLADRVGAMTSPSDGVAWRSDAASLAPSALEPRAREGLQLRRVPSISSTADTPTVRSDGGVV